jgi:hypothetical protein
MSTISPYWIFVSIAMSGNIMQMVMPNVQEWIQEQFSDAEAAHSKIQQTLVSRMRSRSVSNGESPKAINRWPAIDALRCFISNEIKRTCQELTTRFGETGGFHLGELLVRVLDDVDINKPLKLDQPDAAYQPLAAKILQRFDPQQAQLSTWTNRMVISHPELSRFLQQECGIYLASDWSILNGMTPDRLRRLSDRASAVDIEQWATLLSAYHAVYRRDRLQRRANRSKCLPPTDAQLQEIAAKIGQPNQTPNQVLDNLHRLAEQLRQWRSPQIQSFDTVSNTAELAAPEPDDDPTQDFLQQYRQLVQTCLSESVERVLDERLEHHRRKQSPTDQAFLTALYLFHCEQQSMGAIAKHIGLQKQYQVSRLLNLSALRTDIQQTLFLNLRDRLPTVLPNDQPLTPKITEALNVSIAHLFDTARAESTTVNRTSSPLTDCICHHSKLRRSV